MSGAKIKGVVKRDGRIQPFDPARIEAAARKALEAAGDAPDPGAAAAAVAKAVAARLEEEGAEFPHVERIQDEAERALMRLGFYAAAKAYILYREQRRQVREMKALVSRDLIDAYLDEADWRVRENANAGFSLQGLNNYLVGALAAEYWLERVYPPEVRDAHRNGDMHTHDLNLTSPYCMGWDLQLLLQEGFNGVPGYTEANPPKHLRSALGQLYNFIYTLQGETAGANAVSNWDTLLAPYVRADGLKYEQVKQAVQEFVFNLNVPTRVGFQTPFSNISLDVLVPEFLSREPCVVGGKEMPFSYGDLQEEVDMLNRAFCEVMLEGDAKGRGFTFPIPTYSVTPGFFERPIAAHVFRLAARYGSPYFANFISSDMKPEDVRSLCCRLRLDNRELLKRGGGLFGANPSTGSIGVCTLNLPRLAYLAKDEDDFFARLARLASVAVTALEVKRKALERFAEAGLYPFTSRYLAGVKKRFGRLFANHFSTIGVVGGNEMCLNLLGVGIAHPEGKRLAVKVLEFLREFCRRAQERTGNLYNLEATPAEGCSYRLAKIDKEKYPDIVVANEEAWRKGAAPYYTNSTMLPVDATDDVFEVLDHQDNLQVLYTGGCIEKGNYVLTDRGLMKIEDIVANFQQLRPLYVLSYNKAMGIAEWDEVVDALAIDVAKHNKVRITAERGLDITVSDWHPFFVLERHRFSGQCPICGIAADTFRDLGRHLRYNPECRKAYKALPKYNIVERRADELKKGDYILQNAFNCLPDDPSGVADDLLWLIGFFIGNGCISHRIDNRGGNNLDKYIVRFFTGHRAAADKVAALLNEYFGCEAKPRRQDNRSRGYVVAACKSAVSEFFFNLGYVDGEKVYTANVTPQVKRLLTKHNVYHFISGLMDSDGYVDAKQGDFEYCTVSRVLAIDLLEILTLAGLMVSMHTKQPHRSNEKTLYRLRVPCYCLSVVKDKLSTVVYADRISRTVSNKAARHLPIVRVTNVSKTDVADAQFYDLTTAKNHNYLAGKNTLVFVHNTVVHVWIGEENPDPGACAEFVRRVFASYRLPYLSLTPTYSVCPAHGYLSGRHDTCPKCGAECEVYSRVVGYYRPVKRWNAGKQAEFGDRKTFSVGAAGR